MKVVNDGKCRLLFWMLMLAVLLICQASIASAASNNNDYLNTAGSKINDSAGNEVRLTGIAWFGFETTNQVYHGIWSVKMENVLDTVANNGFNLLRIPLSVQLVNQWRNGNGGTPDSVNYSVNPGLQGMTSLQILDASIAYCKKVGIKVMLDMHRVVNTQMLEGWYTTGYPASDYEACWKWLAEHYKDDDTVIAMDIFNEPHGTPGNANMIKWDSSTDQNNWKSEAEKVGNAILDINPNLLIVVEGVEATPKDGYTYAETNSANYNFNWWGGNLRGVKNTPVNLGSRQGQLVYSPHDYGPSVYAQPWFSSGFTEASLTADCWDPNWLYIAKQSIAPILIGEWGGKMDGGDNQRYMGYLANTITTNKLNHTFWCVNPNSGDTGGILLDDWATVDTAKYNLVEPTLWKNSSGKYIGLDHEVNLGANGTHVGGSTTPAENDSAISPATTSFDKNTTKQADIAVTMTLNGNTLSAIRNGSTALVSGTDYTASANTVTILKSYLVKQAVGTVSLTFDFSAGVDPVLAVTVIDTSSGTATTPCSNPVSTALPLVLNGAGEFCRVTTGTISNINSWNMQLVEINGVAYTNAWSDKMPAKINGSYYIHCVGSYAWSHLEVDGSGGSTQTVTVTGITVSAMSASVNAGSTTTLTATVSPTNATNKSISWSSSNTSVAAVSSTGVVTGVSAGSATITATTADGGFKATSAVTVTNTTTANYTLSIAVSGNGSTSPAAGTHTYASVTSVSVTATPASGATFTGWSGAATGTANPVAVTMDANKTLTANFSGGSSGLPDKCPGQCNSATPVNPTILSDGGLGNVTMYSTAASNGGACNYGSTNVMYYAAMSVNVASGDGKGQWQGGHICGQCAEVTALTSQGPKTVVVRIMDKCPDGNCGIDLGGSAPAAIMLDGSGRYDGKWHFVSCDGHSGVSDGSPTLNVLNGSNSWWSRVHVRNPLTAVDYIEWQDTAGSTKGTFPFAVDPENAFEVPVNEVLQSGITSFLITVHYVDGRTATVRLTPAQLGTQGGSYTLS
jgi:endoglucanase